MRYFDDGNDVSEGSKSDDPFSEAPEFIESIDTWWEWALLIVGGLIFWGVALMFWNKFTARKLMK